MQEELFPEIKDAEKFAAAGHVELTYQKVLERVKERINRLFPQKVPLQSKDVDIRLDE